MIVLKAEIYSWIKSNVDTQTQLLLRFIEKDEGDVYLGSINAGVVLHPTPAYLLGLLRYDQGGENPNLEEKIDEDSIQVIVEVKESSNGYEFRGWLYNNSESIWVQVNVLIIPDNQQIFEKNEGLYETAVLKEKSVLIVGLGSGGSTITIELAKAGVGKFILIDHDRLELRNITRHTCSMEDIGRYKTKSVRDQILNRNPSALVKTFEQEITWGWYENLQELVKEVDVIFCCTDNRPSRLIINKISIDMNRVCIYGGTFRRAYGGQVIRIIPNETMCYQCFINIMPEKDEDIEISNSQQIQSIAYSDRPSIIEPGLSSDILPISNMCVKLGILELLKGTKTSLSSLYEDLIDSAFQWLNRREIGTVYADLPPLVISEDNMRILSWYSMEIQRDPNCMVCGNDEHKMTEINLFEDDIKKFGMS